MVTGYTGDYTTDIELFRGSLQKLNVNIDDK